MNPPKCDDLDYIHLLIAAQRDFNGAEAARAASEGQNASAHHAFTRLLQRPPLESVWKYVHPATGSCGQPTMTPPVEAETCDRRFCPGVARNFQPLGQITKPFIKHPLRWLIEQPRLYCLRSRFFTSSHSAYRMGTFRWLSHSRRMPAALHTSRRAIYLSPR